jgi:hypothetical protein
MIIHVTGIDVNNNELINNFIGNVMQLFPNCSQCSINYPDATTLDIIMDLE